MPEPEEKVTDAPFTTVPSGGTQDTFDDNLQKLDGTDPAENLSLLNPAGEDGVPSAKELNPDTEAAPAEDLQDPKRDDDDAQVTVREDEKEPEAKEPEKKDDDDEVYTEGDRLKELGHEGYDSIEEFTKAQEQAQEEAATALKQSYAKLGIQLQGRTPQELAQEVAMYGDQITALAPAKRETETKKADASDDISQTIKTLLTEHGDEPPTKDAVRFHRDFAEAITAPLNEKIKEYEQQAQHVGNLAVVQDFMTDRMLYDLAVSARKGDGHVPSFQEARRAVDADRRANPQAWAQTLYRLTTFAKDEDNPFLGKIDQWRGQKNAAGITNERVAEKRAAAKVAKFQRQTRSGEPVDRKKTSKLSEAAAIAATRKLPVSVLDRG